MPWTYSTEDDQIFDDEFESMEKADEFAQEAFNIECEMEGRRGLHYSEIKLLDFYYDEDNERVITASVPSTLEWRYEPPLRDQHFRQSDFV